MVNPRKAYPAYLELWQSGELARRIQLGLQKLADCVLCPRKCHVNRLIGDAAGMHAMVQFEDKTIMQRARRNQVELVSADDYYLTKPPGNEFIFGFSALPERMIQEGIKRLT